MKNRLTLLTFTLLLAIGSRAFIPDNDPLDRLVSKLDSFRAENPVEKIHLHIDRPYYAIGDTIWFKSYLVNATHNELSALSKVIYIDLISQQDSIKKSLKLPVFQGLSWGSITLSDSLPEGSYRLRAYTNWMRNSDKDFFYERVLNIGANYQTKVFSQVEYKYLTVGKQNIVEAILSFIDDKGKPLADRDVKYQVELGGRDISKGRNTTDAEGRIKVNFTNNLPASQKTGVINASIEIDKNTHVSKSHAITRTSDDTDIQFFAESGNLIAGLMSKLAIKATGTDGRGRKVDCEIKDQEGNVIHSISTGHAGMVSFLMMPEAGKIYKALFKLPDGSNKEVRLPEVQSSGYVLAVNNRHNIVVSIQHTPDLSSEGQMTLVAQQNGVVKYLARTAATKTEALAQIEVGRFETGIVHLTLFNTKNEPVAERLVFVRKPEKLKVSMNTDKDIYGQKEKINLSFDVRNTLDSAEFANFSLSVFNESKVPYNEASEPSIYSNLLLSSDLKGYIEDPAYYFTGVNAEVNSDLDNLMLTHGWRRFTWQDLEGRKPIARSFQPEEGIVISGQVTNDGTKPMPNARLLLMATRGSVLILDTVADEQGRFRFPTLSMPDSVSIVLQARKAKGGKFVTIRLDEIPPQYVTQNKNTGDLNINVNEAMMAYLRSKKSDTDILRQYGLLRRNIILDEVKITEKKQQTQPSNNLNGSGRANYVLEGDNLNTFPSIFQALTTVPGLLVQNNMVSSTRSPGQPMHVTVDGMPMDQDILNTLVPADIEKIEVLRTIDLLAIYGGQGSGGVLVVTTRRGDPNYVRNTYTPGIITFKPRGYSYTRQFYAPKYDEASAPKNLPDRRTTIFWRPNITSDKSGKASLSFFSADEPGTYRLVIEGLDGKGSIFRRTKQIKVN